MALKPAAQTPLTAAALPQVLTDAGLPGEVLNIIRFSRAGEVIEPVVRDPRLRKLSGTSLRRCGSGCQPLRTFLS